MPTSSPPSSVTGSHGRSPMSLPRGQEREAGQPLPSRTRQMCWSHLTERDCGHRIPSHPKDAPGSCCWPGTGEETWQFWCLPSTSLCPLSPPCPQTAVPGADRPSQLPTSPGGLRGDVHQEPQPDALWQRADRECPVKAGWFLVLGTLPTLRQWAGKSRCVQVGSWSRDWKAPAAARQMMTSGHLSSLFSDSDEAPQCPCRLMHTHPPPQPPCWLIAKILPNEGAIG